MYTYLQRRSHFQQFFINIFASYSSGNGFKLDGTVDFFSVAIVENGEPYKQIGAYKCFHVHGSEFLC